MKHLKIYENNNNELWVVFEISNLTPDDFSLEIFDDKESAENYFVEIVNYKVQQEIYDYDKDYVFTVEQAKKAQEELTYNIRYGKYRNNGKYKLPERLKIGRDTNKYNL